MLFKISYAIKEELIHSAQTQFAGGDEKWYGMKLIGRWHEPSSTCLLYTSPSPRDGLLSRMPSSA